MNCNCDFPARYIISRDGKPGFTCGSGRCRFYALSPVQCEGYTRVTLGAPGSPPADTGVVLRFEALVHPDHSDVTCCMLRVQGDPQRWAALRTDVLQDPQFEGMWYTTAKAFLYPMAQYSRLVHAIKARSLPNTALEEIPPFYLRCVERLRQIPQQYAEEVAAGRARLPDTDDCVFRQLKPFQKDGVRFVLAHQGRAMIADDMGLGKTVQAIAVAHHYRDEWPVLVVCPMSLLENWAKEFNKFCGIPYTRIAILQGTKATATSLQDVIIVSYSSLKCVEQARFNVVILDESHYIKAGAAKRAQISLRICRDSRRVLLLSGTPAMSRPMELYAQLQAMQPSIVPSKAHFGARYCNSYVSRFGIDVTGHSHTDELHSLLRHYVIRRTKKELGNELPSKSRQLLYVYVTEKEKKAMEKQIGALRRSLASSSSASSSSAMHASNAGGNTDLTARTPNAFEMKMATARAKIPAVQDYVSSIVEQHLDSGEKVILFAHHQCMMEAVKAAVEAVRPRQPIDYIYISGDTPAAQREPAAEHFRSEPTCTVAILSMQSSGTGHNFTCASTVVFTELDWNPSTHLQCEDRVHRIGQSQPCHIKYLLAEGTSDSVIWPLLQTKLSVTTAMFENTSSAAEQHLYDGVDKRNVARRDVASTAAGVATAASTPCSSQQSTLDRFIPQPSSSQSGRGDEGSRSSMPASRPSVHAQQQHQRSSGLFSTQPDGAETPGLLLTPTNPDQHLGDSLMGSPLSLPRGSGTKQLGAAAGDAQPSVASAAAAAAPSLVVPFSVMGSAFAEPGPRLPKHAATSSFSGAHASPTHSGAAGAPSRRVAAGSDIQSPGSAAPTTSASVLDLLRQTTSKSSPKTPHTRPVSEVAEVVDLTYSDGASSPQLASLPASSSPLFVPLTAVKATAGAAAPPRRTVFTLTPATVSATPKPNSTSATVAPTAPPSLREVVRGSEHAASTASAVPVAAPVTFPSSAATKPHLPPARSTLPPAPEAASARNGAAGAIRIPLRANLHFKRPRCDADGSGGCSTHTVEAHDGLTEQTSVQSVPTLLDRAIPLTTSVPSSLPHTQGKKDQLSVVAGVSHALPSATSTAAMVSSHSAAGAAPPFGMRSMTSASGFPLALSPTAAAPPPRRTLFKLVSGNAIPQQPLGKDVSGASQ